MFDKSTLMLFACFYVYVCFAEVAEAGYVSEHAAMHEKVVIEEETYVFFEQQFIVPLKVEYIEEINAKYDSPVDSVIARFSSMREGNLSWWNKQWGGVLMASEVINDFANIGVNKDVLVKKWKALFINNEIYLYSLIRYDDYAIVLYGVRPLNGSVNTGAKLPMILKKHNKKWLFTNELMSSVLLKKSPWVSGIYDVHERSLWKLGDGE